MEQSEQETLELDASTQRMPDMLSGAVERLFAERERAESKLDVLRELDEKRLRLIIEKLELQVSALRAYQRGRFETETPPEPFAPTPPAPTFRTREERAGAARVRRVPPR